MEDMLGLKNYKPMKKYLICIDSDGCAFDTMEIKHKECFCPATVEQWNLQGVSKFVRDAWDYVNLYSTMRGTNRFLALLQVVQFLEEREEVKERNVKLPDMTRLLEWSKDNPHLNNQDLSRYPNDPVLVQALKWSLDCNERIAKMVHGIPPFPYVKQSLEKAVEFADIVVVSATAEEALVREWKDGGLLPFVHRVCGQESGSKAECIRAIKDYYELEKCVMIGDAMGDLSAAHDNLILFYPIIPEKESWSWQCFYKEYIEKFQIMLYDEEEPGLVEDYCGCLLTMPPWK